MCHCDFPRCSGLGQARCSRYDSVRFPVNRIYSIIDIAKRDAYVCGIAEAYCMHVADGIMQSSAPLANSDPSYENASVFTESPCLTRAFFNTYWIMFKMGSVNNRRAVLSNEKCPQAVKQLAWNYISCRGANCSPN